ncbi:hypothetical protein [Neorhodopirellula lusitana]|uniref:hypothetical protein n=1 Tax=Neorhodopirellula lusitana TaxID=445327 RepID=UPI00384A8245
MNQLIPRFSYMRFLRQAFVSAALLASIAVTGCQSIHGSRNACDQAPFCQSACDSMAVGCDALCDSGGGTSGNVQLVRGRKVALLDGLGSVLGSVNKLALWDRRADNHNISPQTEEAVVQYLRENGLGSTLVRSNQYDPIGEWHRLASNKRMAAPLRYTFGTYDWLKYTVLPGRLTGGDWYNPYSDTVHLYSDIPTIGLAKAAYAKDVYSRSGPASYAALQDLPLIGLYHETIANREVLQFTRSHGGSAAVTEAERILYPDLAGSIGAQTLGIFPYGSVVGRGAGALVGHTALAVKDRVVR